MLGKWTKSIMDHSISVRERQFRLLTGTNIAAFLLLFLLGLFLGKNMFNRMMLSGYIVLVAGIRFWSLKSRRVSAGSIGIAVLLVLFVSFNFFTSGGMYGGAPVWFVFCFAYISMVLSGMQRNILLAVCLLSVLVCHWAGFYHSDTVMEFSMQFAFYDLTTSVILVGALICTMVLFQNFVFREESRISNQQREEIEKLNQSEKRFFASMSHEIRTPINTIIGLNEMILREDVSDEVAENARNIQGASKMLLTLINDILDLSKIESGRMDVVKVSYETGAMFSDIINMIWIKAKEKGLEFHMDIDSSIPSMLCGDEVRIKQILINLLNNSVKYTSEGSVTLAVRCERLKMNQVRVYYRISDTGMGIKKESIPHLFDAFKRVDEEKNRYIEGTGLGLSIVRQLVDLMGGEITVNSVYTKGSDFLVTLDQEIIDGKALGQFTLESYGKVSERAQYQQSFTAPEAHLLIVDDNEMNLIVAAKLLADTQVKIDTVKSGAECLRLTQTKHYDGILMDHLMPEMDGIACIHALRRQEGGLCQETPVIALTANAGSDSQLLYKKEGFSGYLAKPVSGMLLEAAVLSILPEELVVVSEDGGQTEIGRDVLMFDQKLRLPLTITTDSGSDLPEELIEELGLSVCPYYVYTEKGRFLDMVEMVPDDLLAHVMEGRKGHSQSPEMADYEQFFARELTRAQNIIHITMTKGTSNAYRNAVEAAKSFENVTVLDSELISGGTGMMVMYAARMAKQGASKTEVLAALKSMRRRIPADFIINDTQMLYQAGRFPKGMKAMCDALLAHPIVGIHRNRMTMGGIRFGDFGHAGRSFIRSLLKKSRDIDKSAAFIIYVGMNEEAIAQIRQTVLQYCAFEKIYIQKASAAISINCGPGTFGLFYLRKEKQREFM